MARQILLYTPGPLTWDDSQLIYHALADLGREAVCLTWPDKPYVSIGFSQTLSEEVDENHCQTAGLPLFRREVGGGTVLLDGNQLFFQLVIRPDHPAVPVRRESFYRRFLTPAINTYRSLGLAAEHFPINDICVDRGKITGTGAGEIEDCIAFVGNLLIDFDFAAMARLIQAPDDQFRNRFQKAMEREMSTMAREAGQPAESFDRADLCRRLADEYASILGPLVPAEIDDELRQAMDRRREWMLRQKWLHRRGRRRKHRQVKVRAGVELIRREIETSSGSLWAEYEIMDGFLTGLKFGGPALQSDAAWPNRLAQQAEGWPAEKTQELIEQIRSEF